MPERVLVACNSDLPSSALLKELVDWSDHVVGADSGADRLLAVGVEPDAIVGDMDSVSPDARKRVAAKDFHLNDDPNTTDLDKCIAYAGRRGARQVRVVGATSGRLDHTVAALSSLVRAPPGVRVVLVDDWFDTWLVEGSERFSAPRGTVVSLVAPGGARGVTTRGLRWPLEDADLAFSTLGIHNEVADDPVEVTVRDGHLFLMKGRFIEPHG